MPRRRRSRGSRRLEPFTRAGVLALAATSGMVGSACGPSSSDEDSATTASSSSAIIGGTPSPAAQNFVVELVHPVSGGADVCSGSLVAPNLVLTARHCVTETADVGFTCDPSGNGSDGGSLGGDYDPKTVFVYVGLVTPAVSAVPDAHGIRFFHDGATNLCNHDLALIELDHALQGFPIATLDLDSNVTNGETVTAVGWGVTASGLTPAVRQQRGGILIEEVGPASDSAGYAVASSEFAVGESICEGDSGGPALDGDNAVVGVVSRGGNGVDSPSSDPAVTCLGAAAVNLYTETAPFRDLILNAFAAVGAVPTRVGVPIGEACVVSSECTSNLCAAVTEDAGTTCTEDCSSAACPGGSRCDTSGASPFCVPSPSASGCAVSTSPAAESHAWVTMLVAIGAFFSLRLRRREP